MIINTFSYLWKATAIDAICELSANGFHEFEVPISSPHCWPDDMSLKVRSEAKQRLADNSASIVSLNAGGYDINLASPAANMRRKSTDHIKDVIDLAYDWEVADVVISPGTRRPMISPSLPMTLGWLYESLEVLLPRAEQAGVRLLLENTPYCFRPTFDEMAGVVKEVNNDNLKIVYDVANAAYIQEDPVKTVLAGHAMIGLIHISDTGLDVWGHDPIGTGVIDFDALGKAVNETGLTKKVVLEIIREIEPLAEVKKGIIELKKRYWIV
jgi:L-ribulose-5-phosphate 3-epimerase